MFTALDHCHEAIEITSDDHVIQVWEEALRIINTDKEPFTFFPPLHLKYFPMIFSHLRIFLRRGKLVYEKMTGKVKD